MSVAKLSFVVALCAVCASGADLLDNTPADGATDTKYCVNDAGCTWNGDSGATCLVATGLCECSAEYTGDYCQSAVGGAPTPPPSRVTRYNFLITFLEAVCNSEEIATLLQQTRANLLARGISAVLRALCGSVSLNIDVESELQNVDTLVSQITTAVKAAAVAQANFTKVDETSVLDVSVSPAQTSVEAVPLCASNAVNTVYTYDKRCIIAECAVGYTATVINTTDSKQTMVCLSDTRSVTSDDDDLSDASIAALVIGSVFVVVVFVALLYFLLVKRGESGDDALEESKNEPYVEEAAEDGPVDVLV